MSQGDIEQDGTPVHRDVFGKPCVTYEAISRAHVTNPDIFDHIVSANNHCLLVIKLHLCYLKSQHCIDLQIPGNQRKEVVLGIYPMIKTFRYKAKEIFWVQKIRPICSLGSIGVCHGKLGGPKLTPANAVELLAYLTDVLTKIVNGHPNSEIDELLPWAYAEKPELKAWLSYGVALRFWIYRRLFG
jgi:hypothetical protein